MPFNLILKELMTKHNVTNYRLAKDLGISKGTISNYLTGATLPQSSIRDKILNYFNNDESLRDSSTITDSTIPDPNNPIINNKLEPMDAGLYYRMMDFIMKESSEKTELIKLLSNKIPDSELKAIEKGNVSKKVI